MISISISLLSTLIAFTVTDARMVKRQGTLTASGDATDFGKCSVPEIQGERWFP